MRYTPLPIEPRREHFASSGFALHRLHLGAEQRESLARGLAFVVVLMLSCLMIAFAPLAWGSQGPAAAAGVQKSSAPAAARATWRLAPHAPPIRSLLPR